MAQVFYDAVLLGDTLGTWLCANLLQRRRLNVAVVPQYPLASHVALGGVQLPARPQTCTALATPIGKTLMTELGLYAQQWLEKSPSEQVQIAVPGHRFGLFEDRHRFLEEIIREFSSVTDSLEDWHLRSAELVQNWNLYLEKCPLELKPNFLQRQRSQHLLQKFGLAEAAGQRTLLRDLSKFHPFITALRLVSRFSDASAKWPDSDIQLARQYHLALASRQIGISQSAVIKKLRDLFVQQQGKVYAHEQVQGIMTNHQRVRGVRFKNVDEGLSCEILVSGLDVRDLHTLVDAPLYGPEMAYPKPRYLTMTQHMLLHPRGVPDFLEPELYWLPELQANDAFEEGYAVNSFRDGEGRVALTVRSFLPLSALSQWNQYQSLMVQQLGTLFPHYEKHLLEGPHCSTPKNLEHALRRFPLIYGHTFEDDLSLKGIPVATDIRGIYVCNDQTLPGLGDEGLFWTASLIAGHIMRKQSRYRRLQQVGLSRIGA